MPAHTQLLCFAKAPEIGRVKTRLAAHIGNEAALHVYQELLRRTVQACHDWAGPVHIFRTGNTACFLNSPLAQFSHSEQYQGNLGERLWHGVQSMVNDGPVICIGTDCPDICLAHLQALAAGLMESDVCIGPANDGGYWGIALQEHLAADICFADDLPWSQTNLLNETKQRLESAGLRVRLSNTLNDLDDETDLQDAQQLGFPSLAQLQATAAWPS